jgi:peptidoglycan/LPS O-acetylase OafA/YrhL
VTHSAFRRNSDVLGFAKARILRIFPGLIVCALTVPLALMATGAWADGSLTGALTYAARLVSLVFVEFTNPAVFADLPFAHAINGSVWSLRHEVGAYALLLVFVASGVFFTNRWVLLAYCAAVVAISALGHVLAPHATGGVWFLVAETRVVIISFLLGVLTHRLAGWIWVDWRIAALMWGAFALGQSFATDTVAIFGLIIVLSYSVLCLAYLGKASKGLPVDLSYGVYIYGWPLQQLVVFAGLTYFGLVPSPLALFLLVLPGLLLVALGSWILIERPAIRFGQKSAALARKAPLPLGYLAAQGKA